MATRRRATLDATGYSEEKATTTCTAEVVGTRSSATRATTTSLAVEARTQLNGGPGNDVIVAGDDKVADEVDGGGGFDICYLSGPDHSSLAQRTCEEVISFGPNDDLSESDKNSN
jgi:hypothetical protein